MLSAGAAAPVAAADSPFGDLWSDDDDTDDAEDLTLTERLEETIDMARSWGVGVGGGLADRVSYEASQSTPWADPPNLSAEATDTRETINGNSTQIVDYLNNQTDAANASVDNTTVHELRLVDEDHARSESIYPCSSTTRRRASGRLSRPTRVTTARPITSTDLADSSRRTPPTKLTGSSPNTSPTVSRLRATERTTRACSHGTPARSAQTPNRHFDDGFDGFEDGADS